MFPQEVELNEENIAKLTSVYKQAYAQIVTEITSASNFGIANRKAILTQIEDILQDMGGEIDSLITTEITSAYHEGAGQGAKQLEHIGADVDISTGFNRIHKEAILALVDDTSRSFGESIQGVNRSAQLLLNKGVRDQITQQMALGKIGGKALKEVKNTVTGILENEGLDALIDKAGHSWTLDRYAEMLIRTKSVEARNRGLANRIAENGYDLVQVSSHGADDVCADWEGKILSVTGDHPTYSSVADAEADGLFHPNCKHAINVLIPKLAIETSAYDTEEGEYLEPIRKTVDKDIKRAVSFNKEFLKRVETIGAANSFKVIAGPVKTAERALEKVVSEYAMDVKKLRDTNRSIVLIKNPRNIQPILDDIEKEFGNIELVRNDFDKKGYKKILVNVKTPKGNVAEIQLTTEEFYQARINGGHKLYEQIRANVGDVDKLIEEMNKLYEDAAKALERRLNSS